MCINSRENKGERQNTQDINDSVSHQRGIVGYHFFISLFLPIGILVGYNLIASSFDWE